jgi:hypothetical protein
VITRILTLVAVLAVVGAGGTVWLVVRDSHGRTRTSSARVLRRLAGTSALVVVGTLSVLRPWYWDGALGAIAVVGFVAFDRMVRVLQHRPSPAGWGPITLALGSVLLGSGLVTVGGMAAVLDTAALTGAEAVPVAHQRQVLAHAVLYQVFWGPAWASAPPPPALGEAVAFQRQLPNSVWSAAVLSSGFGVSSLVSGGCWVDATPALRPTMASSTVSGVFPQEIRRVLSGHRPVSPCPGAADDPVPAHLAQDALVALWLDPHVVYRLGGVSVHGVLSWPGRPHGLAVTGLTDGYASWHLSGCAARRACRTLPEGASASYALSHEVVEGVTNPYGHGWFADPPLRWSARYVLSHGPSSLFGSSPVFPGEVADLCQPGQEDARSTRPGPSGWGGAPYSGASGTAGTVGAAGLTLAAFFRPQVGCVE